MVLGPLTAERLGNEYFVLELDCIAVKGKKEGVNIFTVFYNPSSEEELVEWNHKKEIHDLMLAYYRRQQWDKAVALITEVLKGSFNKGMDNYYTLWIERIEEMRGSDLPTDWDGVFRATSK